MSEEMPTPMADELAAKIPEIPWSGNETEKVRQAVYGALAAWLGLARELERNLGALAAASAAKNHPPLALGPEHAADDGDARPKSHAKSDPSRPGLAKTLHEAMNAPPAPDRSHAPNPKNANRKGKRR